MVVCLHNSREVAAAAVDSILTMNDEMMLFECLVFAEAEVCAK